MSANKRAGAKPDDVTVSLGDPAAHAHDWRSTGRDKNGAHELVCECGETGSGYGDFPAAD